MGHIKDRKLRSKMSAVALSEKRADKAREDSEIVGPCPGRALGHKLTSGRHSHSHSPVLACYSSFRPCQVSCSLRRPSSGHTVCRSRRYMTPRVSRRRARALSLTSRMVEGLSRTGAERDGESEVL